MILFGVRQIEQAAVKEEDDYIVDAGASAQAKFYEWSEQECVRRGWIYPDFLEIGDILLAKEKKKMHWTEPGKAFMILEKPVRYRTARKSDILDSYMWNVKYLNLSVSPPRTQIGPLFENDLLDYEVWREGVLVWSQQTMIDLEEQQKAIWENNLDE